MKEIEIQLKLFANEAVSLDQLLIGAITIYFQIQQEPEVVSNLKPIIEMRSGGCLGDDDIWSVEKTFKNTI